MKIDRYTKVVLTIIAVGIIGLNVHFFKDDFIKEAHAGYEFHTHKHVKWHEHYSSEITDFLDRVQKIVTLDCVSETTKHYTKEGYYISCEKP
jgi:hypothetical protein